MTEPARGTSTEGPGGHPPRRAPAGRRLHTFATVARLAGPPAALAIVATLALAIYLVTFNGSRGPGVNVWLMTIGTLLVWTCLRALASALPTAGASAFESVRVRPVEPPSKQYEVIAIEGAILDAEWNPGGMEFGLRRLLRKIAASRLVERHQIDLETDPTAARRILGEELWALIEPHAHGPETRASGTGHDKGRRGVPRATIRRAIEILEAL